MNMAARPSWQGHLRLSLVSCPVALYNAVSPRGEVHFRLINPETGNRIKMVTIDAETEEQVERSQLIKGFEISKGEYVTVTPEEINSVRLESTKTIDIERFVPGDEIDRLYWDNPYYMVPDGKMAAEPFAVIRAAMERSGNVALGRLVMNQRERLIALEARGDAVIATTLRAYDEVRSLKDIGHAPTTTKPDSDMIAIAEKIMTQKEAKFDASKFEDRYEDALRALIHDKQKGRKITPPKAPRESNVVDLMDALKQSLKGAPAKAHSATRKARAPAHPPARARGAAKKPARRAHAKR